MSSLLATYLNDHLAGATGGLELARRAAGSNRESDYGRALEQLAREIAEDRQALLEIMDRLDVGVDRAKVALAWSAEKLGRLKLNGRLTSYSPLSRLEELEGLALGIHGKHLLWRALERTRGEDPRLATVDLARLRERAKAQHRAVEQLRRRAAPAAIGTDR